MNSIFTALLPTILGWLSPVARKALESGLRSFYQAALDSPSAWDDVAARLLCFLFNVDVSGLKASGLPGTGSMPDEIAEVVAESIIEVATGMSEPPAPVGN